MEDYKKKYEISQDGNKYILTTEIYNGNIRLTCVELNKSNPLVYIGDFTLEYLKQLSSLFSSVSIIEQALILINDTIEARKVNIESKGDYINILLYLLNETQDPTINFSLKNIPLNEENFVYSQNNEPDEIYFTKPVYLPGIIHTKLPTIHTRLPTVHTTVIENYSKKKKPPSANKMSLSSNPQYSNNIVQHQQTMNSTRINRPQIGLESPILEENINYNFTPASPKREQINYIIPGSPSTAQFNYSAISSHKNQNILRKPNIQNQRSLLDYNPISDKGTIISSSPYEDSQKIFQLQNETNRIKREHELLKNNTNKLISQIQQLRNQIQILNNENQNLRKNNGIIPNQNQIHEIMILNKEIGRLSNELSNIQNQKNNELEQYKKIKEEEINAYKLQIEELLNNQKNNELINNEKEKENKELKLQIQELLKQNNLELSQKPYILKSNSNQQLVQDPYLNIVKGEIMKSNVELEFLTRKICRNSKKLTLNLLYKASIDSDKAAAFHSKCDGAKSSLVLIESGNGKRFGGFTSCDWKGKSIDKKDDNAFVFSLDKMKIYDIIQGEDAIGCYPKFGPVFLGCQIRIYDDAFTKGGTTFEKGINYETEEDYELTGGIREFMVKEIEVYSVELE